MSNWLICFKTANLLQHKVTAVYSLFIYLTFIQKYCTEQANKTTFWLLHLRAIRSLSFLSSNKCGRPFSRTLIICGISKIYLLFHTLSSRRHFFWELTPDLGCEKMLKRVLSTWWMSAVKSNSVLHTTPYLPRLHQRQAVWWPSLHKANPEEDEIEKSKSDNEARPQPAEAWVWFGPAAVYMSSPTLLYPPFTSLLCPVHYRW